MKNPRTKVATTSFTVSVADKNNCAIASLSTGLSVQMTSVPSFSAIAVATDNSYNGFTANYQIDVTPSLDMVTNDVFYIQFPPEVTLPSSPVCTVVTSLASATCTSPTSNYLKVKLTFSSSPLASGTRFSFKVASVKNAPSTKTTSAFSGIEALDSLGNQIASYTGADKTIQNTSPAPATGSLVNTDTGVS